MELQLKSILFKKEYTSGLYNYLHISDIDVNDGITSLKTDTILNGNQFKYSVFLATYLTITLQNFVIARFSPSLQKQSFVQHSQTINWRYNVIADDYNGLGIDKGFTNTAQNAEEQFVLFATNDLLSLQSMPEDTFGDNVSYCSVFGLQNYRTKQLTEFIHSASQPKLSDFLLKDELFINIISSKKLGYYHSLLIKSVNDIQQKLDSFQSVLDSSN